MRLRGGRAGPLGQTLAAVAVSSCFAAPAFANPTGHNVVRGTADIHRVGNLLQITNSPNAIINWQSFSIGANEITRFIQQSPSSAVLNRVTTQNPSQILGTLQSRLSDGVTRGGKVFLINPNGIVFGQGSKIDVGGLVASTLKLSNEDFLAGNQRYGDGLGKAVVNQGSITTGTGGSVYLVGPAVTNEGIIRSPHGEVVLAAGNSVELVNPGTPNLRVEVIASDNAARNLGRIVADAGRIGIYAGLVTQSGTARADSAVAEGGRIVLKATKNATLEAGSVTSASGATGGSITVQSGDTTLVAGTVEAIGASRKGGSVQALGNFVGVTGNARIDASGETGGGTVLVGGDFQGKNPEVQNAYRTYVGADTTISADAVTSGDGGKVIVWSDDATRAYGTISARGGARSGNGGFVEVSGKNYLDFNAGVNVGARAGRAGTLLLDPQDITISNTITADDNQLNSGVPAGGDVAGAVFFADGGGGNFTISDEALEAQTGNIVLQASRDITVNNNLSGGLNLVNQGSGERVVLQAGRDITIGSPITTAGAAIILEADSVHSSSSAANGSGTLTINAAVTSNGGHITLIGGGNPILSGGGISLSENQTINAGAGGIDIALSGNASLGVGTLGLLTQILGNPMDELHTTGPLRVGVATTAGSDGLGAGAQPLLANSVTNIFPGSAIDLSPATGSTFELHAGSGGIVLDQPLTTFQGTAINTTGTLTVNDPVNTSNNNLSITAANVIFGANGSINTGTASCSGPGCPVSTRFWDGGGGPDKSWFNRFNWSGDAVPTLGDDVRIDSGFGTIVISGDDALAKSLLANSALEISSTGSLSLANASQFTQQFTLAGGSLLGAGSAAVTGSTGSLTWSGGTMSSGGTFLLGSASSGTLSNALTLSRLFENQGALTLLGATVSGSGSFANSGLLTAAAGTTNAINVPLTNIINTTLGTLQVNGMLAATSFPANAGIINIGAAGTLSTGNASLTNEVGATIQAAAGGTLNLGAGGSFTNGGSATFDGSYDVATTNASAGTLTLNGAAGTATLNLSGGTVAGTGDLTVTTDFNQTGGTLGSTFGDLVLHKSGNFTVGAAGITAVDSVKLIANGGGITLNGAVTASSGTGDAVVLAGDSFTNNAGASALDAGAGRWLVWSANPASDSRGGLVYDFKQYNASFGVSPVQGTGNGFLYSVAPSITPALGGTAAKVYDGDAVAPTVNLAVSAGLGVIDSDTVTLLLAGAAYDNRNADINKQVTANGISINGASNGGKPVYGYQLSSTSASANVGEIQKRPITIVSQPGQGKTYGDDDPAGAATAYALSGGSTLAPVGGDSLNGSMGRVTGEGVGSYAFTQGGVNVNDGNSGGNYLVTFNGATNRFQIAARSLGATIANQTKVYGANDPLLSGIGVGLTGLVNRTVADINGNNTGINDIGAVSTTLASLTRATGESVAALPYAITGGTFSALTGSRAGNYTGPILAGSPTLSVTPAGLTATIGNQSKPYGADDPAVSGIGVTLGGLVNRTVSTWNGNVSVNDSGLTSSVVSLTRAPGESIGTRSITGGTFTAPNGNYSAPTLAGSPTLAITKANLTALIVNQTKGYGADDPALGGIGVTLGGLVNRTVSTWNGEVVVNDSGLTSSVASLTRAAGESVGTRSITAGTFTAPSGNYNDPALAGSPTLTITKANLTASIADQAKDFGTNDPALGGIGVGVSGLVNRTVSTWNGNVAVNDSGLTSSLSSLARDAGENVGSYAVTNGVFSAPSGNYNAPALAGSPTLTIQPVALAVNADPQSKMFGAPDPTLSFQASGLVSASVTDWNGTVTAINDTAGTALTGSLARNAGETVGTYGINQGTLGAGNYSLSYTGNSLAITPDPTNFQWAAGGNGAWDNPLNWNQGVLPVANSVVIIPGLSASNTITYSSASGTTNLTSITSTASFIVNGGTLNLSGTGSLASSFPSLTLAGGTLGGNGTINAPTLNVLAGGVLGGSRIINGDVSNLGGVVAMGASPGTITINGNYSQGPAGTLQTEIAGAAASQYDRLVVNGNAALDGTLRVDLLNGYVPADGESFTFVQSSGSLSGTFASTNFPTTPQFSAGYLPASMFVAVTGIVVPPPAAVASASQVVVALTDQNQNTLVASQATGAPVDGLDQPQQQEREELQRKPMCNASNGGGGGGGGGGLTGGGGFRCNTRGCF